MAAKNCNLLSPKAKLSLAFVTAAVFPLQALSAPSIDCSVHLKRELMDQQSTQISRESLNVIFDESCNANGSVKDSSIATKLDAVIDALPIEFTLSAQDKNVAISNFCRTYASTSRDKYNFSTSRSKFSKKAYDTYIACLQISSQGHSVSHNILTNSDFNIDFQSATESNLKIKGVKTSKNIDCTGNTEGKTIKFSQSTIYDFNGYFQLTCTRSSREDAKGNTVYDAGDVSVSTNVGPYTVYLPESKYIPIQDAEVLNQIIDGLKQAIIDTNNTINKDKQALNLTLPNLVLGDYPSRKCPDTYNEIGPVLLQHAPNDINISKTVQWYANSRSSTAPHPRYDDLSRAPAYAWMLCGR